VEGTAPLPLPEPEMEPDAPLTETLGLEPLAEGLGDRLPLGAVALEAGTEVKESENEGTGNDENDGSTERGKESELWLGRGGPSVGMTDGKDSVPRLVPVWAVA